MAFMKKIRLANSQTMVWTLDASPARPNISRQTAPKKTTTGNPHTQHTPHSKSQRKTKNPQTSCCSSPPPSTCIQYHIAPYDDNHSPHPRVPVPVSYRIPTPHHNHKEPRTTHPKTTNSHTKPITRPPHPHDTVLLSYRTGILVLLHRVMNE